MDQDNTKIFDSHYSESDSAEVRRAYYEALKKSPPTKRRLVITKKEWEQYKKAGADMAQFITLQDLRKAERDQHRIQMKERNELNKNR